MDAQLMMDELKKDLEAKVIFTSYTEYINKKAHLTYLAKEIQPNNGFERPYPQFYGIERTESLCDFSDIIRKHNQVIFFGLNEEAIPVVRVYDKTNGKKLFDVVYHYDATPDEALVHAVEAAFQVFETITADLTASTSELLLTPTGAPTSPMFEPQRYRPNNRRFQDCQYKNVRLSLQNIFNLIAALKNTQAMYAGQELEDATVQRITNALANMAEGFKYWKERYEKMEEIHNLLVETLGFDPYPKKD